MFQDLQESSDERRWSLYCVHVFFGMKELLFALRCPYRPVKAVITQGLITESSWEAEDSAHWGQKYPSNMEVMERINITKVAQTRAEPVEQHTPVARPGFFFNKSLQRSFCAASCFGAFQLHYLRNRNRVHRITSASSD